MSFDNQNKIIKQNNPIDYIEEYFRFFDDILRDSENKIILNAKGLWNTYKISITWKEEKIFEISTYLHNSSKTKTNKSIYLLISNINEKVRLGYFNYNQKLDTVFFYYRFSVKGQDRLPLSRLNILLILPEKSVTDFSCFLRFFNRKKSVENAIDIAILETCGEA